MVLNRIYLSHTLSFSETTYTFSKLKKKTVKKLFFVIAISIATISVSNAQNAETVSKTTERSVEDLAKKRTEGFSKRFEIPKDLEPKIYSIMLDRISSIRNAKAVSPPNTKAIKAANKKFQSGLKGVLSPEQYKKVKDGYAKSMAKVKKEKGKTAFKELQMSE
jgi:hypothetical protein